jgi:hypothetical protein
MKTELWTWTRVQFFRFWTALVVLGAYGYFWLNTPEYLTWWKRMVNTLIEKGCDTLSYPWGGRCHVRGFYLSIARDAHSPHL